jgi:hypothetical protein
MSHYDALQAVTRTLQHLLETHITNSGEPGLAGVEILLRSPREMREDSLVGVSLWLYRVERFAHTLNKPPVREAPDRIRRQPLPVNLYYLVTPITEDPADEQLLLGKILEVFNDFQTLRGPLLQAGLEGGAEEFRLTLEPLALEELTRIWDALKEPYSLSMSYLVQTVEIDAGREAQAVTPVSERRSRYDQIVAVE